MKRVNELTAKDFERLPVWRYDASDEMALHPVRKLPVSDLRGCVVGVSARLYSGDGAFVVLSNLHLRSAAMREQFLNVHFLRGADVYTVPRYFDPEWAGWNPSDAAHFLGLDGICIFPIFIDVSEFCAAQDDLVRFHYDPNACPRMSEDERLDLLMENL